MIKIKLLGKSYLVSFFHKKFNVFSDTHKETLCCYSIQYKNGCLPACDLFLTITRSIKFFTFYYLLLKSTDV